MFRIETERLHLILEIMPVGALRLHEEVIPDQARRLLLEFSNWAHLENPIIVHENGMVLDGHHRAFAFQELGFRYISVCRIDYLNEAVQLRYWFRSVPRVASPGVLDPILSDMGANREPVEDGRSLTEILCREPLACGMQQDHLFWVVRFSPRRVMDGVDAYAALEELQCQLMAAGACPRYVPCQSVLEACAAGPLSTDDLVLWTPRISKNMVLEAVEAGKRFSPKATRHLIPARPLNVNVPARWFREDISLEEQNRRFASFLAEKRVRRFGPGQILQGRYYEEELFVFHDEKSYPSGSGFSGEQHPDSTKMDRRS